MCKIHEKNLMCPTFLVVQNDLLTSLGYFKKKFAVDINRVQPSHYLLETGLCVNHFILTMLFWFLSSAF